MNLLTNLEIHSTRTAIKACTGNYKHIKYWMNCLRRDEPCMWPIASQPLFWIISYRPKGLYNDVCITLYCGVRSQELLATYRNKLILISNYSCSLLIRIRWESVYSYLSYPSVIDALCLNSTTIAPNMAIVWHNNILLTTLTPQL